MHNLSYPSQRREGRQGSASRSYRQFVSSVRRAGGASSPTRTGLLGVDAPAGLTGGDLSALEGWVRANLPGGPP
jgi:hypothetical protein